jgi:AraC-like DNA-binding protein
MEVLSDILRSMRVEGSVYFCDYLVAPWNLNFEKNANANFHLVRRGECWVVAGERVERLGPGDLVFVGPGKHHALQSQLDGYGAQPAGSETLLLCGYCSFDQQIETPLKNVFPSLTVVRDGELIKHPWLKSTLDQLSAEYLSQQPGAELIVNKLTEIVLVELIRIDFARKEAGQFVAALSDKYISGALQRMHDSPEHEWTLDVMSSKVGLSRAAFARRFKQMVGQPMFGYLSALRVQRAKEMLRETQLPSYEIASRVGYTSEVSFVKAFKKLTGTTPHRYRKNPRLSNSD